MSKNSTKQKNPEDQLLEVLLKKYEYSKGISVRRHDIRFNVLSTNVRSNERLYVVESGVVGLKKDYKILYAISRDGNSKVVSVYNDHPLRDGLQLITNIEVKSADEIFELAKYSLKSLTKLADLINDQ